MKKGFILNTTKAGFALLLCLIMLGISSCRKKDSTCYALITVTDAGGASVSGANVHLHANSVSGQVEATGTTDGAGQITFDFKLQAIFNVDADKGGLMGSGIVKLEPGETVEKTVIIQ